MPLPERRFSSAVMKKIHPLKLAREIKSPAHELRVDIYEKGFDYAYQLQEHFPIDPQHLQEVTTRTKEDNKNIKLQDRFSTHFFLISAFEHSLPKGMEKNKAIKLASFLRKKAKSEDIQDDIANIAFTKEEKELGKIVGEKNLQAAYGLMTEIFKEVQEMELTRVRVQAIMTLMMHTTLRGVTRARSIIRKLMTEIHY
ncbi:MAG TPA: hypothetical protein VJH23_05245 [archaeon]|nr:hypothetical protein [archaeon]